MLGRRRSAEIHRKDMESSHRHLRITPGEWDAFMDDLAQTLEALKRIADGRGSSTFLFADELTLAASNPLDVEWVSGKGELVRITD